MDINKKNKTIPKLNKIELYKSRMREISFLAEYLEDVPEIFDVRSEKCKLFLVKIFTVLNPNFHHLSLLGYDSIGQELARAASILQIYPSDQNGKTGEIFRDKNDVEIHNFWMRFFKLCKINSPYIDSNLTDESVEEGWNFQSIFCNLSETIKYFSHDVSVIDQKKLKGIDVDSEVKSWRPSRQESMSYDSMEGGRKDLVFQKKHEICVDINELIADVHSVKKNAHFLSLHVSELSCPYADFFKNFNQLVRTVKTFRDNIKIVSSFSLQNILEETSMHEGSYWLSNNTQIQRCNDIIKDILLKDKQR